MNIAYNPSTATALTSSTVSKTDLVFDLAGKNIWAKGTQFKGTDTTYSVFKKHTSSSGGGYNGLVPVPSYTTTQVRYLREDGTWVTPPNTTYSVFTGASASAAGSTGLVPKPSAGAQLLFLNGGSSWSKVPWDSLSDVPTTISGYGLTDELNKTYLRLDGTNTMVGNILAGTNNTYNLGSSSYKWANIYTTNVNATSIILTAQSSDSAKIYTTIDGAATYVDFYLADDNNSDAWRWRFKPSGGTEYSAMTLLSTAQDKAKLTISGTVVATTFTGALNGNASTATKLATARTITLTGSVTGSGSFDGSGNLSIDTTTNHTHSYLPLSGGTMTGNICFSAAQYLYWNNGTYRQRIFITDDSTTNTAVFTFQQSEDSGSSFKNLLTIKDNGYIVADTFVGNFSGNATTATTATKLGTSTVGSASLPIYLKDGTATAVTSSSLFSSLINSNNNISITIAGQTRTLTPAYASNADTVDSWHLSEIVKSCYLQLSGSGLSSWWCKFWDCTFSTRQYNDADITFYIHSAYKLKWGIVVVRCRQNGANNQTSDTPSYNVTRAFYCIAGNLDTSRFRMYYDDTTGKVELWADVASQYGVYNIKVLSVTNRVGSELQSMYGTLYTVNQSTTPTEPSLPTYQELAYLTIYNSISGNATTATKLQTTRTIWGQSFNGTTDITGTLKNVGTITPLTNRTYEVGTSSTLFIRVHSQVFRNYYDDNMYISLMASSRPILFCTSSDGTTSTIDMTITSAGNVGIGTTSPSYKLHVNGTVGITGDLTMSGGNIYLGTSHYIYGATNGTGTALLSSDGTRTVIGSYGASNTAATMIRSYGVPVIARSTTAGGTLTEYANVDSGNISSYTAGAATKVIVNYHNTNDVKYPIVWSNQSSTSTVTANQLYKSSNFYVNPSAGSITATTFVGALSGNATSATNADTVDGLHASSFVKISGITRSTQKDNGSYVKILTFTVDSSRYDPSISFTMHPTECNRTLWNDCQITVRKSSTPYFYVVYKGTDRRTLWVVSDDGATYDVWISATKTSYDGYTIPQVTNTYQIKSFSTGNLAYSDDAPTGTTYTVTASISGVTHAATKLLTARTLWGQSFDGTANISGAMTGVSTLTGTGTTKAVIDLTDSTGRILIRPAGTTSLGFSLSTTYFKPYDTSTGQIDLGTSSARWNGIYGTSLNLNGAITGATTIAASGAVTITRTLHVGGTFSEGYDQGIRLYGKAKESSWSIVNFGCDPSATTGTHTYQWLLGRNSSNNFVVDVNAASGSALTILASNKYVGIGNTSPSYRLHVGGTVGISSTLTVTGAATFSSTIASAGNITVTKSTTDATQVSVSNSNGKVSLYTGSNRGVYSDTNSSWVIATNGTNTFTMIGNLGVGTSTPSYKLHVAGTMYASGAATLASTLAVTGAATFSSTIAVTGAATLSSTLTMGGLITTTSGSTLNGIKIGETYINAIGKRLILQNTDEIRFATGTTWAYDSWAGLKYIHSSKTIYLGIADGTYFTKNSTAQTGGTVKLVNCGLYVPDASQFFGEQLFAYSTYIDPWSGTSCAAKFSGNVGIGGNLLVTGSITATNFIGSASKLGSSTIGSLNNPIYLNLGIPVACNLPTSGSWFQGVPYVGTSGVMEIGKCIDFHSTNADTSDYDVRLTATGSKALTIDATTTATGFIKSGYDDNYVLLAGGGTSLLADLALTNGRYNLPMILAAGYIYKSTHKATSWYFNGSYNRVISSITASSSSDNLAITVSITRNTTYAPTVVYLEAMITEVRTTFTSSGGEDKTTTGSTTGRSYGSYWLRSWLNGNDTGYIVAYRQRDNNNDSWTTDPTDHTADSNNYSNLPIRSINIIIIGYGY